jgi:flagellar basal-body rod protein FlgG
MNTLETALLSMQADQTRLTGIGQNLANVSTPGYKRVMHVRAPQAAFAAHVDDALAGASRVDMSPGSLRTTGKPLDLVVEGGWLELRSASGLSYARGGSFQIDADGDIATASGAKLQLVAGDLKAPAPGRVLRIDAQGMAFAGDEPLGRLRIVQFDDAQALQPMGNGQYQIAQEGQPVPAAVRQADGAATVRSGYVEASNVQSTQEMVALLETSRHFEAMQKLLQGYDEAIEKAIRKFGEV